MSAERVAALTEEDHADLWAEFGPDSAGLSAIDTIERIVARHVAAALDDGLRERVEALAVRWESQPNARDLRATLAAQPTAAAKSDTCKHRIAVGKFCAGCDMYDEPATPEPTAKEGAS